MVGGGLQPYEGPTQVGAGLTGAFSWNTYLPLFHVSSPPYDSVAGFQGLGKGGEGRPKEGGEKGRTKWKHRISHVIIITS